MKHILWVLSILGCSWLYGQDAQPFSLSEAVAYAEKESPSMRQAQIDMAYAHAQVRDYTSIGIPQVSAGIDYRYNIQLPVSLIPATAFNPMAPEDEYLRVKFGVNHNLNMSVTASTLVFDGSYFVGLQAAKGLVELNRRRSEMTKHDIKYGVKSAYLTVLMLEENRRVVERNMENLSKMLEETRIFYANGFVEALDVDRLVLSRANLATELDVVRRQIDFAYNALKFQMNYPLDKAIVLTDSLAALMEEADMEDLNGAVAFEKRPEISVLEQNEYLQSLNARRYQMQYLPNMTAFITHQQSLQRNNLFTDKIPFFPTTIFGVSLNVPIFDGLGTHSKIQMARLDKERVALQIKETKRGISLEVQNARSNYGNAKERLENQKNNLALAERILATTKTKYREGVGSSFEMNQAEQELYRNQAAYMNALYDLLMAKNNLDKALGN